jgi:hypothetical protein
MWIKLLIGAMIIIAIILGATTYTTYLDQETLAANFESKIKTDTLTLSTLTDQTQSIQAEIADIAKKIDKAQADLVSNQVNLTEMKNSNEVVRKIIDFGDAAGVKVIPMGIQEWTSQKIGLRDYHVLHISIEVNGPQQKVISFIRQVQDSVDQYLVIQNLDMTKITSDNTPAANGTEAADTGVNLQIAIYAR